MPSAGATGWPTTWSGRGCTAGGVDGVRNRATADEPRRAPARMSVVSTIGYTAFIAGPPLLGFLGDHVGILRSLLVVGGMAAVAIVALPAVREPNRP